ncbi:DUF2911 domain-containing protein [candidate division KSB1 bacterium]|nr:DUF2911 domain-containing protein [candidate division KSB1 bacterium]
MNLLSRSIRAFFVLLLSFTLIMCAKKEEGAQAQNKEKAATQTEKPAEQVSNRGTANAAFGGKSVSINYGRPQLKGRDMLAMAPEGTVWRMGMNEATEIKTEADLKFGETVIPAGSYSLWMKKGSGDKWNLVFNKKTGIWGHEHPPADDLAAVPMTVTANETSVEAFTIEVTGDGESSGEIKAMWGKSIVAAAFTIAAKTTAQ